MFDDTMSFPIYGRLSDVFLWVSVGILGVIAL